jgi:hypothetical protein
LIAITFIAQMRHIGSAPKGMTDRLHEVVAGQRQYKAAYGNEGLKRKKALREQGLLTGVRV